ncbi:MAG: ABC transporter ATP-binding protein [Terriglobia bacterium]
MNFPASVSGMEIAIADSPAGDSRPLLSVSLSVDYPNRSGVLREVMFEMRSGEVLGLVGQSGSGKSTLALSLMKLLPLKGATLRGEIWFQGRDLIQLKEREMRAIRGRQIGLVLQSPLASLNPALRIGVQLDEAWKAHAKGLRDAGRKMIGELLRDLSLPAEESFLRRYPRQLSVGQAQRLLIALAVLHRPALLIADEPTSALDVITQSELLKLFARLNQQLGMGLFYISHDLLSVASICHRIAILHEGKIVECETTEQIFRAPQHPYTRLLIEAIPKHPL